MKLIKKLFVLCGVISSIFLLLLFRNKAKEKRAVENFPAIGEFVEIEGCYLHYFSQGQGENILLLHGEGGNLYDYYLSPLWKKLTANYRVTAIDLAGYGYSKRVANKKYGFNQQAHIIESFIQKVGIEQPILLGYKESCGIIISMLSRNDEKYKEAILINDSLPEKIGYLEGFLSKKYLGKLLVKTLLPISKELELNCKKTELSMEHFEKIPFDLKSSQLITQYENKNYMNESAFNNTKQIKTPIKVISTTSSKKAPSILPLVKKHFEDYEYSYIGNYETISELFSSKIFFDALDKALVSQKKLL